MYFIDGSFLKAWLYLYSSLYFTISLMFPTTLAHAIHWRQELLISALKVIKNRETTRDQDRDVEKLRTMIEIYSEFAEVFDEISLCYGIPTMLVTAVIFLQSIMMAFAIYKSVVLTGRLTMTVVTAFMYSIFYGLLFNANAALNTFISMQVSR